MLMEGRAVGHRWMKKQKDIDDGRMKHNETTIVVSANRRAIAIAAKV